MPIINGEVIFKSKKELDYFLEHMPKSKQKKFNFWKDSPLSPQVLVLQVCKKDYKIAMKGFKNAKR